MAAPVILVDPLPRTLDLSTTPSVRARLAKLGRLVISDGQGGNRARAA